MFSLSLNGSYKDLKGHKGHNESGTNTQKILRTDILQQMHYFQFNLLWNVSQNYVISDT